MPRTWREIIKQFTHLAVVAVFAMTPAVAHADLFGDFVTGEIQGGPGAFVVNPPNAIVGDGIEFNIDFITTPAFSVDFGASSVTVIQIFGQAISMGAGEILVLGDLDGVGGDQVIVGITNFQTNQSGITESDITWTDHEVRFTMSNNVWQNGNFASWDLVIVPSPSALALIGMAGLFGRRRRR